MGAGDQNNNICSPIQIAQRILHSSLQNNPLPIYAQLEGLLARVGPSVMVCPSDGPSDVVRPSGSWCLDAADSAYSAEWTDLYRQNVKCEPVEMK
jgi:hypothetical protein